VTEVLNLEIYREKLSSEIPERSAPGGELRSPDPALRGLPPAAACRARFTPGL
jgi:hypothetical protein